MATHRFCGDGHGGERGGKLGFCTDGFTKEDVLFLIHRLQVDLGVHANLHQTRPNQSHAKIGRLDEAAKLAAIMEPHIPDCCRYKLQHVRPYRGRWGQS